MDRRGSASPDYVPDHRPNGAKATDTWWTVLLIDPVVLPAVRLLNRVTWVTANHVTFLANLLSPISAALFLTGHLLAAALVYELRFMLDCIDGKLARARGTSSARGAYLDPIGDYLTAGLLAAALAVYVVEQGLLGVGWAMALPTAYLAHFVALQARHAEAAAVGFGKRRPDSYRPAGQYAQWMTEHRLSSAPSRIEAEHLLFVVAPIASVLLDEPDILVWGVAWGIAYGLYRTARLIVAGYLIALGRDRATGSGS